jgi:hypothetical protein
MADFALGMAREAVVRTSAFHVGPVSLAIKPQTRRQSSEPFSTALQLIRRRHIAYARLSPIDVRHYSFAIRRVLKLLNCLNWFIFSWLLSFYGRLYYLSES